MMFKPICSGKCHIRTYPKGGYIIRIGLISRIVCALLTIWKVRITTVHFNIYKRVCWERSEEHTSELQSLMRISYAVFCLKKKNKTSLHQLLTLTSVNHSRCIVLCHIYN